MSGHDPQLERGIQYCMHELKSHPPKKPPRPQYRVPRPRALPLASWLAVFAPAFATAALADLSCPVNSYSFHGTGPFTTTAPTLDVTDSPGYHVAYDLPRGTVSMSQGGSLAQTYVLASDAYDVTGVPAGTPVSFTANFTVDGMVWTGGCGGSGCGGYVGIHLGAGPAFNDTTYAIHLFSGSQSFHDVRRLPVTMTAGTPIVIEFRLTGARSPGGSHSSSGDGVISFSDLPSGAGIGSCQGYSTLPTPVRRASWGALKTIYR